MSGTQRFFICKHCGNMLGLIHDKGAPLVCCGDEMTQLVPNTVEASVEKHLPVYTVEKATCSCGCDCICVCAQVGSAPHPMEAEHSIVFVYVETERGGQRKRLSAGEEPKVEFCIANDKPIAIYAYCNLHGLWKTEIDS